MFFEDLIATQDDFSLIDDKLQMKDKYCVEESFNVPGKKKRKKINLYGSGLTGASIKDAVSGFSTGFIVGTTHEDHFFKVSFAKGARTERPVTLFYNTPEEYEKHCHFTLSTEIKHKWYQKQNEISPQ